MWCIASIAQADHSEKPSILALMSRVLSTVLSKYEYFTLQWQVGGHYLPFRYKDGAALILLLTFDLCPHQLPEVYAGAATGLGSPKAAEELAEGEARINVINQEALRFEILYTPCKVGHAKANGYL